MAIDNESPPGSWRREMDKMPWRYAPQQQRVEWALATIRGRGMFDAADILAQEINALKAEVEALRERTR